MTEAEWFACGDAREILGRTQHSFSARKLRLFAVACCRCSRQLLLNATLRQAVDVAERFADGQVTAEELAAAYEQANEIARELYDGESEREIRRWAEAVAVLNATNPFTEPWRAASAAGDAVWQIRRAAPHRNVDPRLVALLRDIFGNPFRPLNPEWIMADVAESIRSLPQFANLRFDPAWLTSDVVGLARGIYEDRAFDRMPILADALQDAGCNNDDVLAHCREPNEHVRGCWVVDLVLGKS
jgi:hypothetical protein